MEGPPPDDPPNLGEKRLPVYMTTRHNDGVLRVLQLRAKGNDLDSPNPQTDEPRLPSNPFVIARSIEAAIGYENRKLVTATKEARGTRYVLRTQSPIIYKALICMTHLIDESKTQVEVIDHPRYNFTKGVVFDQDTINVSDEDLLEELREQGVTLVRRITKKISEKETKNTPLVVLTFRGTVRPNFIYFGMIRTNVRPYYDSVLICRKCSAYGHSIKNCSNEAVCLTCSQTHTIPENQPCKNSPFCRHCEGPHSPVSKDCPIFRREEAVIRLKTDRGITFNEARKEIEETTKNASYSSKVQNRLSEFSDKDREIKLLREELAKLRNQMKDYVSLKNELEELKSSIQNVTKSNSKNLQPEKSIQTNLPQTNYAEVSTKARLSRKDSGTNNNNKPSNSTKSTTQQPSSNTTKNYSCSVSRKRILDISPPTTETKKLIKCPEPSHEIVVSTEIEMLDDSE
ncbi:uncharacterized protein LOC129758636 [Uranotaenia lowii]|uniref:uncharacterized protein LOC129758636 n=1 Tax=Uranotaenia lowii TaxID=190385 RepID=UPI002479733E|nr:uncharacterized protein LOC129758636 [Uranotaenia lowii]